MKVFDNLPVNEAVMKEVLDHYGGKVIHAKSNGNAGDEVRDILGVRLTFNRQSKSMKLDLEDHIVKVAQAAPKA